VSRHSTPIALTNLKLGVGDSLLFAAATVVVAGADAGALID